MWERGGFLIYNVVEFTPNQLVASHAATSLHDIYGDYAPQSIKRRHESVVERMEDVYDQSQPTVAIYDGRTFGGAELLSRAANILRLGGVVVPNFVNINPGLRSEQLDDRGHLAVSRGYLLNEDSYIVTFDLDDPINVSLADHGISSGIKTVTRHMLDLHGVPNLRPEESFVFDDKFVTKNALTEANINTPHGRLFESGAFSDLETFVKQRKDRFVVKTVRGMQGFEVYVFDEGFSESKFQLICDQHHVRPVDLIVEDYIESAELKGGGFDTEHAWNLRVIALNGYIGGFARVNTKDKPVNVAQDGSVLQLNELESLIESTRNGLRFDNIMATVVETTDRVCELVPDTALGLDYIVSPDGVVTVIEINVEDFGAFESMAASDGSAQLEAAKRMVLKIGQLSTLSDKEDFALADQCEAFSINDQFALLRSLAAKLSSEYRKSDLEEPGKAFVSENAALLQRLYQETMALYLQGERSYSIATLSALYKTARSGGDESMLSAIEQHVAGNPLASTFVRR